MTAHIHYFNPGHETAIVQGTANYTPPLNVRKMATELALLPLWYADPNDFVWVNEDSALHLLAHLPQGLPPMATPFSLKETNQLFADYPDTLEAVPWGLSPHSIGLFEGLKREAIPNLRVPLWREEYKTLTGRQTAAHCLNKLRERLPARHIPTTPTFYTTLKELENHPNLSSGTWVIKSPYSSSGRGLLWVRDGNMGEKDKEWVQGAMHKQGMVSLERGLDKCLDFALEYYSDGNGEVVYEGLSLFATEEKGTYSGNVVASQKIIRERLLHYVSEEELLQIQEAVREVLREVYSTAYTGYLGVDMLIYRTEEGHAIHPCVEINMRYTMGMLAIHLFRKWLTPDAIGHFYICHNRRSGEAYQQHLLLEKSHPLTLVEGEVGSGYLPLCPITPESHYSAYLLLS